MEGVLFYMAQGDGNLKNAIKNGGGAEKCEKIKTLSTTWEIVFLTLWRCVQMEVEITEIFGDLFFVLFINS